VIPPRPRHDEVFKRLVSRWSPRYTKTAGTAIDGRAGVRVQSARTRDTLGGTRRTMLSSRVVRATAPDPLIDRSTKIPMRAEAPARAALGESKSGHRARRPVFVDLAGVASPAPQAAPARARGIKRGRCNWEDRGQVAGGPRSRPGPPADVRGILADVRSAADRASGRGSFAKGVKDYTPELDSTQVRRTPSWP